MPYKPIPQTELSPTMGLSVYLAPALARPGEASDGKVKVNLNFDSAMRRISFQRKASTLLFRTLLPSIFTKITAKYDCSEVSAIWSLALFCFSFAHWNSQEKALIVDPPRRAHVLWIGHSSIYLRVASTLGSRCYFQYARCGWKDNIAKNIRRLLL